MDHTTACALAYWRGNEPWGSREQLDRLAQSTSLADRQAAAEIGLLKTTAFEWMEASTPVDWTSAATEAALKQLLTGRFRWCDDQVFTQAWTWLRCLGWHDGY